MSFAENMGKSLSNKYGKKLIDSAKIVTTDAIKTASRRAIQKSAEAACDLIGNKIADKATNISKKSNDNNDDDDDDDYDGGLQLTTHKKRYISPEERKQIIEELRLVPKKYA